MEQNKEQDYYYLIEPLTGEIIDYIDKRFYNQYNQYNYKRNKDIISNYSFGTRPIDQD